ncbi:hypothetical protein RSAG8_09716, partial [Rhizoctonia solani AG-8 WAC10335]
MVHHAGVPSKNVTLGVPRLKETINIAKNPEYALNEHMARNIRTKFTHTTLRTIAVTTEIIYDPDPQNATIDEDRDFIETFFAIPDQ